MATGHCDAMPIVVSKIISLSDWMQADDYENIKEDKQKDMLSRLIGNKTRSSSRLYYTKLFYIIPPHILKVNSIMGKRKKTTTTTKGNDDNNANYILQNISSNVNIQKIIDSSSIKKMIFNISCCDVFIAE